MTNVKVFMQMLASFQPIRSRYEVTGVEVWNVLDYKMYLDVDVEYSASMQLIH